jgi:hypothetical protein
VTDASKLVWPIATTEPVAVETYDVYVAGPMRGIPLYNFPAFDAAAAFYRSQGLTVLSPAELDREHGIDPTTLPTGHDWSVEPPGTTFGELISRDLAVLPRCRSISLLDRWTGSEGARMELSRALELGLEVRDAARDMEQHYRLLENASPMTSKEVRTTDPTTGGQKGAKLARYDLVPEKALWKLAELYGAGATKYAAHNWRLGYDWSKSIAAIGRHTALFKEGQDIDPDPLLQGAPHMACVAFHAFALLVFMDEHREKDDRWSAVRGQLAGGL